MSFDYYQILQVKPTATNAEIKTAYRKLAKLFHPDKNPGAEDKFRIIKEAYEILIDEVSRNRYDVKRNYDITVSQIKKTEPVKKQKTYTFTEPELKHRQYYKEHYKPKQTNYPGKAAGVKTNYKELTYILISIPVAVSLLLLLINIYQIPKTKKLDTKNVKEISKTDTVKIK
jgi:curved DNA-binding protein CbpA